MSLVDDWKNRHRPVGDFSSSQVFGFIRYVSYVHPKVACSVSKYLDTLPAHVLIRMVFELTERGSVYEQKEAKNSGRNSR